MKELPILAIALVFAGCATGPHLGRATDVVITETGNDQPGAPGAQCDDFRLTPQQARAFLNRAIIVTGPEIHDNYLWSSCYVKGTANLRGWPYTWTIRSLGTGHVDLFGLGEYVYEIADPRQKSDDDY